MVPMGNTAATNPKTASNRGPSKIVFSQSSQRLFNRCSIPDVCIDERRLPLFIARATLRDLIAGLEARATGDAAR